MHTSVNLRSAAMKSVAGTASVAGDGFLSARQLSRGATSRQINKVYAGKDSADQEVERGKSREEIAELIEVTVGSLQVTCSRLRISLRQPRLDNGNPLASARPAPATRAATNKCLAQSNKSHTAIKATKNRPLNNLTCRACHRARLHGPTWRTKWNWNTC